MYCTNRELCDLVVNIEQGSMEITLQMLKIFYFTAVLSILRHYSVYIVLLLLINVKSP